MVQVHHFLLLSQQLVAAAVLDEILLTLQLVVQVAVVQVQLVLWELRVHQVKVLRAVMDLIAEGLVLLAVAVAVVLQLWVQTEHLAPVHQVGRVAQVLQAA
jgi:hypothetical protein